MRISILNAGQQPDYLYGLVSGLSEIPSLEIEVVDSTNSVGAFETFRNVTLFNLRGDNASQQSFLTKAWRTAQYYIRLLLYTAHTPSKIFHIQWENSIILFDRTLLILYYKLFGKKLIVTAHNVYRESRDGKPSPLRWLSLKMMYQSVDRIIVHTLKMKEELCACFQISPEKVIIVPHGINNRVQKKGMTQEEARQRLGISPAAHVVLFFGQIDEYKGIEILLDAAAVLIKEDPSMRLIVAGKPKHGSRYLEKLKIQIERTMPKEHVRFDPRFIPDDEVETFFAGTDCIVLPYRKIFQSGIIFLAYRFGVPIIATDIGSFREDILHGITGYICQPDNPQDMAMQIRIFFQSTLFQQREKSRASINAIAERKYSWAECSRQTFEVYTHVAKWK
jgi:D-inositol-3-phosphate glycosyltransferase